MPSARALRKSIAPVVAGYTVLPPTGMSEEAKDVIALVAAGWRVTCRCKARRYYLE